MTASPSSLDRRDFLRTATGGFALGGLLGLGLDLRAAQDETRGFNFSTMTEVPSVCPYCAVGCGQLVGVRDKKIINIEGNPASPINQGTLCPKGAAAYQLVVNEHRVTRVWYRKAGATEWDKTKTLNWAMEQIADRVQKTRDANWQDTITVKSKDGKEHVRRVSRTLAIASLGGATLDNEWNYVQAKLLRGLGVVCIENQARI